jgi:hypothetical protein
MKKNSLTPNQGLSLSQAQSISNLCNQRAGEITNLLSTVNNYEKSVEVDGTDYVTVKGVRLPSNVVGLIEEKCKLHACQAFLMENIKAKDEMLIKAKLEKAIWDGEMPVEPKMVKAEVLPQVDETFGWEQLTVAEIAQYTEAEAYASHVGQFIHQRSPLDRLRSELPTIPSIEWMTIKDGVKTPVKIKVHHTSEELLNVHEEFAAIHRKHEQTVNYFKAKVKNLTTEENARIAKVNADASADAEKQNQVLRTEYQNAVKAYGEALQQARNEFEKNRQAKIKEIASMRIKVDARFQETVDTFLSQLSSTEE